MDFIARAYASVAGCQFDRQQFEPSATRKKTRWTGVILDVKSVHRN
jgi:hypothetical protein